MYNKTYRKLFVRVERGRVTQTQVTGAGHSLGSLSVSLDDDGLGDIILPGRVVLLTSERVAIAEDILIESRMTTHAENSNKGKRQDGSGREGA